jgi:hypothetical protein
MQIPCICPPKATGEVRHVNGDRVELRERLGFRSALTARNTIALLKQDDPDVQPPEILAALTEVYLEHGIASWTLVDDRGKPTEPNKENVRRLMEFHPDVAMDIGDACDELYTEAVILPLVNRALTSSPDTQTRGSTSPTTTPLPARPKRSRPSSTSTTRTDGIAMMQSAPAGGSN